MALDVTAFAQQLQQLHSCRVLYVGYSGGCDSHALLHLLNTIRQEQSFKLVAIHVNHGLHPESDKWQLHCEKVCQSLDVELHAERVSLDTTSGESIEALARHARYDVYKKLAKDKQDAIVLAHHANDQVETILLQMIRGAGVAGLSGMPFVTDLGQAKLLRPLLGFTRQEVVAYAKSHQLNWIDDPSNMDLKFDRNYLRHQTLPDLYARWPGLTTTLQRVSEHQAEATSLSDTLARIELSSIPHDAQTIDIEKLIVLPRERCKNILRYWLRHICQLEVPTTDQLNQLINDVLLASIDANPQFEISSVLLQRYQGSLYVSNKTGQIKIPSASWDLQTPLQWGNIEISSRPVTGSGLRVDIVEKASITVQPRVGGELCQPVGRQHTHQLKKLFQEWGIPPWQRAQIPLLYIDDKLAQVVGHCVCKGFEAQAGEPGLLVEAQLMK